MHNSPDSSPEPSPFARIRELHLLNRAQDYPFEEIPNDDELRTIADHLNLKSLSKMRLKGTLNPTGHKGWILDATLGATVTQSCVISLEPVKTRIDTRFRRKFLPQSADLPSELDIAEIEDDDVDPLTDTIDLGQFALEELALALPLYPKADGADLDAFAQEQNVEINPPKDSPFDALKSLQKKSQEPN